MLHAPPENPATWIAAVPFTARVHDWTPDLRARLPHAAQALLLGLLGLQAARLAWLLLVPPSPVGMVDAPAALPAATIGVAAGLDAFFPSSSGTEITGDASTIALFGIRSGPDGGSAILGEPGAPQGTYRIGEAIKPGLTLVSIGSDHVLLDSGGRRSRLGFAESEPAAAAPGALPSAAPPVPNGAGPTTVDPQQLLAEAGLQPRLQDGRPSGYTLIPRGDGAVLRQAGLQAGDVVLSINGQALTPERYSALAEELAGQSRLDITFERGGETRSLSLQAQTP